MSTNQDDTILGGLVGKNGSSVQGQNDYGKIYASYSTATVASGSYEFVDSGGLVGNNLRGAIVGSYAAGAVTGNAPTANTAAWRASTSLWARRVSRASSPTATGIPVFARRGGGGAGYTNSAGQSASALQAITDYTGIYAGWIWTWTMRTAITTSLPAAMTRGISAWGITRR